MGWLFVRMYVWNSGAGKLNQNGKGCKKKTQIKFILTSQYHSISTKHLFLDSKPSKYLAIPFSEWALIFKHYHNHFPLTNTHLAGFPLLASLVKAKLFQEAEWSCFFALHQKAREEGLSFSHHFPIIKYEKTPTKTNAYWCL